MKIFIFLITLIMIPIQAYAGTGWSTCHAAGTTELGIKRRNSNNAILISKMTSADAEGYCNDKYIF